MNTKTMWLIIMILVILLVGTFIYFLAFPKIYNSIYTKGVFSERYYIADMITKTGNIPYINNGSIQTINIKEICDGNN